MFNEAVRVARITGRTTKAGFQCGKWAHPSSQFDEDSPAGDRYVAQRSPGRARHNEATENDESDKQEMKNENGVCQKSIGHKDLEMCLVCRLMFGAPVHAAVRPHANRVPRHTERTRSTMAGTPSEELTARRSDNMGEHFFTSSPESSCQIGNIRRSPAFIVAKRPFNSRCGQSLAKKL